MFWMGDMSVDKIFWIVIGVITVSSIVGRYRAQVSRDRVIQTLAERGQPIPPELLTHDRGGIINALLSGIILICIGVALGVVLWLMSMPGAPLDPAQTGFSGLPAVALFPFMIGVGMLVFAYIRRRDDQKK